MATSLNEIADAARVGIELNEEKIPVKPEVAAACELLGMDPLYLANEGKCLALVEKGQADTLLDVMRSLPEGREAAIIGRVTDGSKGRVVLNTAVGGSRIVLSLSGEPLPRIC